jgi:hypothetical protein
MSNAKLLFVWSAAMLLMMLLFYGVGYTNGLWCHPNGGSVCPFWTE